jgi:hypothetical protein
VFPGAACVFALVGRFAQHCHVVDIDIDIDIDIDADSWRPAGAAKGAAGQARGAALAALQNAIAGVRNPRELTGMARERVCRTTGPFRGVMEHR